VLFVCENNLYAMGTRLERSESQPDIHIKAQSYNVPAEVVDGMDVVAVETATRRVCAKIRSGSGPALLECRTYRFRAHSMFDPQLYRDRAEVEEWKHRDPIDRLASWMGESGVLHDSDRAAIEAEVATEIEHSVAFAESGHWEPITELARDVYAAEATR
jgi:TPP-dependent pyruvate/acetoin dehydrogenase alpha subunit